MSRTGSNLRALNRTARKLDLADADAGLLELARSLARAVDADPCSECGAGQNAALWKEYRAALTDLMEAGATDDADDDTKQFRLAVVTPVRAPLRHAEDAG